MTQRPCPCGCDRLDDHVTVEYRSGVEFVTYHLEGGGHKTLFSAREPFTVDGVVYLPDVRGCTRRLMFETLNDDGGGNSHMHLTDPPSDTELNQWVTRGHHPGINLPFQRRPYTDTALTMSAN